MNKMPPSKDIKSAEHHYFPKSLQKFWRNSDGYVSRISWDGKIKHSKNGGFGHIRNAHRIRTSDTPSVWDESFEYTFGQADALFSQVIRGLNLITFPKLNKIGNMLRAILKDSPKMRNGAWSARFEPIRDHAFDRAELAECVASLVVRSPWLRKNIECSVASYGIASEPDKLVAPNQRGMLKPHSTALAERGKFLIAYSPSSEFVFGDGCLNNFWWGGPPSPSHPRCVVALTPNIAVFYECPIGGYMSNDKILAVTLSNSEVKIVNEITMIYSKNYLFYRNKPPNDLTELKLCRHQMLKYHTSPWLDEIFRSLAEAWFPPN